MAHRPGKPKVTTVQIKGHPVRVWHRWGQQYMHEGDLEQALGQPQGSMQAWLQTPDGQAAYAAALRKLATRPERN